MIGKIARRMTDFVEKTGFIETRQDTTKEVIEFGCNILLSLFLSWSIVLILGIKCNTFGESVIYIISFSLIKGVAGGFHASYSETCVFIYIGLFVLTTFLAKRLDPFWIVELFTIVLFIPFCFFAPLGTEKNEIPVSKVAKMKKESITIVILLFMIFTILPIGNTYKRYGILAIVWCEVLILIGVLWKGVQKWKK